MSIKAMKQALEALEQITEVYGAMRENLSKMYPQDGWSAETMTLDKARDGLSTLRQAIAEAALEAKAENARELGLNYEPDPQPKREPLSGEEIMRMWAEAAKPERSTMAMITSFVASIEAAHGIKGEA